MIQLIAPEHYGEFVDEISSMHRLRARVFKDRLDWQVEVHDGLEIDAFDAEKPVYLVQSDADREIRACVRLLPTLGPNMLRDRFAGLLKGAPVPVSPLIWESSRFALDPALPPAGPGLARGTYELFAAMIEFGLSRSLTAIVTVTDVRVERILRRAAWPLLRIGGPQPLGQTSAVAGLLNISVQSLARVRHAGALNGPVLWAPVVPSPETVRREGERFPPAEPVQPKVETPLRPGEERSDVG